MFNFSFKQPKPKNLSSFPNSSIMNFSQRLERDQNDELLVAKDKKYSARCLIGNWPGEKLQQDVSRKITIWKRFLFLPFVVFPSLMSFSLIWLTIAPFCEQNSVECNNKNVKKASKESKHKNRQMIIFYLLNMLTTKIISIESTFVL